MKRFPILSTLYVFFLWSIGLLVVLFACGGCKSATVDPSDPSYAGNAPVGEWKAETGGAGGYGLTETFKNFQYTFTVAENNKPVQITLTSGDINVQYALFDPLGQYKASSSSGRSAVDSYTLNAGTYRVVVMAERRAVGRFTLGVEGTKDGVKRIVTPQLQHNDQDWGTLGGGGYDITFKNHFYTVDVTADNTSIDVELESADTDVSYALYDALGSRVTYNGGKRYMYGISPVKKGTYTIMAGTTTRGAVGKYNLRVTGSIANLTRAESQSATATGRWDATSPTTTTYPYLPYAVYSVRLPANSVALDMELSSPDLSQTWVGLHTEAGIQIRRLYINQNKGYFLMPELKAGTYQIWVYPFDKKYGNYTLTVHGQFTDFKKL